jgi:serine protease inhibitor
LAERHSRLITLLFVALSTAACDLFGPDVPERITQLPRSLTVAEQSVIEYGNGFGFELLAEVAAGDTRANIVLSPLSASMALGMTLNGADGATFDAMRHTLGFESLTQEEINASYAGLVDLLTTLDPAVRFDIANSVWTNQEVSFHQAFLDAVAAAFAARTESRDFGDPETLEAINAWVEESTDGLIQRILDELDPDLAFLLVNAIYFEGAWTTEFDPADTRPGDFHLDSGATVSVQMMSIDDVEVLTGGGPDYSALELLYGGEAFSMVFLLPDFGDDAHTLLASLNSNRWDDIVSGLTPYRYDRISIPKLALTFDAFLNGALRSMGMDAAFRPGADFTRMSPIGDALCIDFVRQKTFLEVDEHGTRAAAVTAVGGGPASFNGFIVNRPFILALRERLSGTVLFLGLIGDPSAEDPGPEPYERTCR